MQRWPSSGALCAGIDPHPALLAAWGLTDDADGLARFAEACVAAFAGHVAVVKPQSAFFERHGARGIAVLEGLLEAFAGTPTLTILDVKRGDIGSTMDGYADAYLAVGAPLGADAVTLSPYLGFGSLVGGPGHGRGRRAGRVRARPHLQPGGRAGAAGRVRRAPDRPVDGGRRGGPERGRRSRWATSGWSSALRGDHGLDLSALNGPVLAPGLGAQGAGPADIAPIFAGVQGLVLPAASRSVLAAGPAVPSLRAAATSLRDELAAAV